VLEAARQLPAVQFNVVGLRQPPDFLLPRNVRSLGWVPDLIPLLQETTVLWRPVRHDGLSFMVLEALAQGRHVIYSYPLSGCIAADGEAAHAELKRLVALQESGSLPVNDKGIETINNEYSAEVVREELLRRWRDIIAEPATGEVAAHAAQAR